MKEQSFRNLVAALILVGVFGGLGLSFLLLASGAGNVLPALCGLGFLAAVFFAWEYLMKPGYGIHARLRRGPSEEEESVSEEPPSPRAP